LKKLQKKVKINHSLALELYATGNTDAMYFAAMIADSKIMKESDIQKWAKNAYWYYLSEHAVVAVASENVDGFSIALNWIDKKEENLASSGWATLSAIISKKPNDELELNIIENLLKRVESEIHKSQNREKYAMNGFVIAVGAFIPELTEIALKTANKIGKVDVFMGETSCKVPLATDYINKIIVMDKVGKKRK